jgi:hypothetical protein
MTEGQQLEAIRTTLMNITVQLHAANEYTYYKEAQKIKKRYRRGKLQRHEAKALIANLRRIWSGASREMGRENWDVITD